MARLAGLVVPGLPHHVTQRGNRRQQTFFRDEDYAAYVEVMADWCEESRYVEFSPVRAGLVPDPADWPWSSARSQLSGRDDRLVRVAPMLAMIADWRGLLNSAIREEDLRDLREHAHTGCPPGNATFVDRLERAVSRILRPRKSGRPSRPLKRP